MTHPQDNARAAAEIERLARDFCVHQGSDPEMLVNEQGKRQWEYFRTTAEWFVTVLRPATETAKAELDRPFMLAAARSWWAAKMTSDAVGVTIKGDGRVTVHWRDEDESGDYTLPSGFLSELATPSPAPAVAGPASGVDFSDEDIAAFQQWQIEKDAVVAAERERCARKAEKVTGGDGAGKIIAAAIREGKNGGEG